MARKERESERQPLSVLTSQQIRPSRTLLLLSTRYSSVFFAGELSKHCAGNKKTATQLQFSVTHARDDFFHFQYPDSVPIACSATTTTIAFVVLARFKTNSKISQSTRVYCVFVSIFIAASKHQAKQQHSSALLVVACLSCLLSLTTKHKSSITHSPLGICKFAFFFWLPCWLSTFTRYSKQYRCVFVCAYQ